MLIGLLIALIFGTSGAESEFDSSIPQIKKEIRRHVEDDIRKDTLLLLVKEYEGSIKEYEKKKNKQYKALNRASRDRSVATPDFMSIYDEYYQSRTNLISTLIDYRILFQENITEEEILLVTDGALNRPDREINKEMRQVNKSEDRLIKLFVDLNEIVVRNINDSLKAEVVVQSLHSFESSIYATLDESYDLQVERIQRLDDRSSSREQLLDMYERSNRLRYAAAGHFAALREDVIANTDQKEWKAINRELKAFLKN